MKIPSLIWSLNLGILFNCVICQVAKAQVTPDNTVNTQVDQNGNVAEITGGQTEGSNLFHSFQDFSVTTGNEAFFNNADTISNIFSRVTGGNVSNIDGLIRANGSASLFLINPAGILFGEGARLDIGGSFYGSTADSILFPDNVDFSASNTQVQPILTINAPIGLGFRDNPGDIVNQSRATNIPKDIDISLLSENNDLFEGLEVKPGNDLALIGGDISLEGGNLIAPGGKVEIGGLKASGIVEFQSNGSLNFPQEIEQADVFLSNESEVNVRASGGGFIKVNARNLILSEGSELFAGIAENKGSANAVAGDITINAAESVQLIGNNDDREGVETGISNHVGIAPVKRQNPNSEDNAQGNAGSIFLEANSLQINNRGTLSVKTFAQGNANNVIIKAEEIILDTGSITSQVRSGGKGNAGNLDLSTNLLSAENFSFILTDTIGEGDAGNITINARDSIVIDGTQDIALILSQVNEKGKGDAGNITINSGETKLINGQIQADTQSKGNAGNINISSENISLDNSLILTQVGENAEGSGGDIKITADSFELTGNSQIIATTQGQGNGGNITVSTTEIMTLDSDSLITSAVEENAIGNAGDIEITSGSLEITGTSFIIANTQGEGNASDVRINVEDKFVLSEESLILAQVLENGGQGNSGNIEIITGTLELQDQALILADTRGQGNAGDINIQADNTISLSQGSVISTDISEDAEGTAGDVNVSAAEIFLEGGSIIASSTAGKGDGGNTKITSDFLSLENFSLIAASTRGDAIGDGGEIIINTNTIKVSDGGIINSFTNTDFDAGEIKINAQTLDITSGGNIFTGTDSTGNAGNISLNISDRIILDGRNAPLRPSNIQPFDDQILNDLESRTGILADATNQSTGNGGNINIDTNFIIAFPKGNSDIVANAFSGNGGNITINAQAVFGIAERPLNPLTNDINASSARGAQFNGNVSLNLSDVNVIQGATELPSNVVEPEQTTAQACQSDRETAAKNSFTIKGKGGISPAPDLPLSSQNITINGEPAANSPNSQYQPISTSYGDIMPARGAIKTDDGQVILTAYRTDNSDRLPESTINCGLD